MTDSGDRRDRPRVVSAGIATIERGPSSAAFEFAIRDVSASGARLVGTAQLSEGELVRATIQLDGVTISVIAQVIRVEPQRSQIALAFRDVSRADSDALARAIASTIDRQRAASANTVIVMHSSADVCAALERDLSRLGRATRTCTTPLETIWALTEPTRYSAMLVGADGSGNDIGAIVEHLTSHYPSIIRVLLFGERLPSTDHATSSRVHAVLRTPWRIRALARALAIDMNDSSLALLTHAELADPDDA